MKTYKLDRLQTKLCPDSLIIEVSDKFIPNSNWKSPYGDFKVLSSPYSLILEELSNTTDDQDYNAIFWKYRSILIDLMVNGVFIRSSLNGGLLTQATPDFKVNASNEIKGVLND